MLFYAKMNVVKNEVVKNDVVKNDVVAKSLMVLTYHISLLMPRLMRYSDLSI